MKPSFFNPANSQRSIAIIVNYLLIAIMIVCFSSVLVSFLEALLPTWNGGYFLIVGFFIALEALISFRIRQKVTVLSLDWIFQTASEIVVIVLVLKLVLLGIHLVEAGGSNPSTIRELIRGEFFDPELLISSIYSLLIWGLATRYADSLSALEEDPEVIALQKMGVVSSDTHETQRTILGMVFGMGAVMLVLTALLRVDFGVVGINFMRRQASILPLVVYFLFSFALLSQTRYAGLRRHWYLESIPIGSQVAIRWAVYSLLLFAIVGFVTILLPTNYSLNILDTIQLFTVYMMGILGLLFGILLAPFVFLIQWLSNLVPTPDRPAIIQPTLAPLSTPAPTAPPVSIAEWLRSALYWGVFLIICISSIVYYLRVRKGIIPNLQNTQSWGFLQRFWSWFKRIFLKVNRSIGESFQGAILGLRFRQEPGSKMSSKVKIDADGNPQLRVRSLYLAMTKYAADHGVPRKTTQTPREYQVDLLSGYPEIDTELQELTDSFIEARYSKHVITYEKANMLERCVSTIREALIRHAGSK